MERGSDNQIKDKKIKSFITKSYDMLIDLLCSSRLPIFAFSKISKLSKLILDIGTSHDMLIGVKEVLYGLALSSYCKLSLDTVVSPYNTYFGHYYITGCTNRRPNSSIRIGTISIL